MTAQRLPGEAVYTLALSEQEADRLTEIMAHSGSISRHLGLYAGLKRERVEEFMGTVFHALTEVGASRYHGNGLLS